MKKNLLISFASFALLSIWVVACQTTDPSASQPDTGQFELQIDNVVGDQDLTLNTGTYTNSSREAFTVTTFNYYLSNFRFRRSDGSEYVVPQDSSYFLVKESDKASQLLAFQNVPVGDYSAVTFTIGVDSLRSTANLSKRTGVLNPAGSATAPNDMYWAWNSGYIFLKLEGLSPEAPVNPAGLNLFQYHIGLFGIPINNTKTVTLLLGAAPAVVSKAQVPQVVVQADVQQIFGSTNKVSIAQHPEVMVAPFSATIANNYSQLFRYVQTRQFILN